MRQIKNFTTMKSLLNVYGVLKNNFDSTYKNIHDKSFLLSLYTIYWSSSLILSELCCHYDQQLFSSGKSTVMKTTVNFQLFYAVFLHTVFINHFTSAADCQAGELISYV